MSEPAGASQSSQSAGSPAGREHAGGDGFLRSPFLVALAGWLLPGLGYWLIRQRARGVISGTAILLLFTAGIFIGGVRVVDVPGYGEGGRRKVDAGGRWALISRPMPTVLEKPWYIGQILAGPVTLVAGRYSLEAAARQYPKGTAHMAEFGTLYCAVAGMLNLLVIMDSASRAAGGK
jgi:hypothetical protein